MKRIIALTFAGIVAGIAVVAALLGPRAEKTWAPDARTWSGLPLAIRWEPSLNKFAPQIMNAVDEVNAQAGCPILAIDSERAPVTLLTTERDPCPGQRAIPIGPNDEAGVYLCSDGTADVQLMRLGHIQEVYLIVLHELGHVLGLDHDDDGLMAAKPNWSPPMPFPLPTFSEPDAKAIAGRYCK